MTKLEETKDLMLSKDYKERFKAEYWQTKIRYSALRQMLTKWRAGMVLAEKTHVRDEEYKYLGFVPVCPYGIYERQLNGMREVLHVLEVRAVLEEINLQDGKGGE